MNHLTESEKTLFESFEFVAKRPYLGMLAGGVLFFVITSYSIHYTKLYDPDPDPGLFQLLPGVRTDEVAQGPPQRGRPGCADRCQQLFRACGGDGHCLVRGRLRRRPGHRCGRSRRSSRDAIGLLFLQSNATLVPAGTPLFLDTLGVSLPFASFFHQGVGRLERPEQVQVPLHGTDP